eukprot:Sdes_comp20459_c0_seq2m14681
MLEYLAITFSSVTNFPESIAQLAYFNACNHISDKFMAFLIGDSVKKISPVIFFNLLLDIKACEEFAQSLGVPHVMDSFLKIKQLTSLFASPDWTIFLQPSIRKENFATVKNSHVVTILEKINTIDSSLFSFHKLDASRKKQIELLLCALSGNPKTQLSGT